jgi:hypothetical protein
MKGQLEMILELQRKLNELGYQPWQLDMIIQDTIGSNLLSDKNEEQMEKVTKILKEYLNFAAKRSQITLMNETIRRRVRL